MSWSERERLVHKYHHWILSDFTISWYCNSLIHERLKISWWKNSLTNAASKYENNDMRMVTSCYIKKNIYHQLKVLYLLSVCLRIDFKRWPTIWQVLKRFTHVIAISWLPCRHACFVTCILKKNFCHAKNVSIYGPCVVK